ncbi:MAG TPA: amino acid racemase, partial [Gemmatimonadaceae bacterium]|nr:amino acid racemase [Gemmatimonadaceae bacterium]
GGLGPESTIDYYRRIIEGWQRHDPATTPPLVIDSLDPNRALALVQNDRGEFFDYILGSVRRLAAAGVDFIAITANTPHLMYDELAAISSRPMISIVEVCAEEARRQGVRRPLLLGTRFTMESSFYQSVLARFDIAVVTPDEADRRWVHERYVDELLKGDFRDETRESFVSLIQRLKDEQEIDAVILGGTELPLLLHSPTVAGLPVLDTTELHVNAIVERLRRS